MKVTGRLGRIGEAVVIALLTALCNSAIELGTEAYREAKEERSRRKGKKRK